MGRHEGALIDVQGGRDDQIHYKLLTFNLKP